MIRINLLPAEFRRRHRGGPSLNIESLILVAGILIAVGFAAFHLWLTVIVVPKAKQELGEATKQLALKKAEADKVRELDKKIQAVQQQEQILQQLDDEKVSHAEVLNDFANMVSRDPWGKEQDGVKDVQVSCRNLTIKPAGAGQKGRGGKAKGAKIRYGFNWGYQLMGPDPNKSGEYVRIFFETIARSPFWTKHGFEGRPDELYNYKGDTPTYLDDVGRTMIQNNLVFTRAIVPRGSQAAAVKDATSAKAAAPAKDAGPRPANPKPVEKGGASDKAAVKADAQPTPPKDPPPKDPPAKAERK